MTFLHHRYSEGNNMPKINCAVKNTIAQLEELIAAGSLPEPKSRRMAEEIVNLMQEISGGRGRETHIPAIESLAQILINEGKYKSCIEAGTFVISVIKEAGEVFFSHIKTHNCATGDCFHLVPAPCQLACPAGIDVPSYVSLIGHGRDGEAIDIIRKVNPFPWVCGLVCTRPCEFDCVRGRIDKPIAIKSLKGFAAEKALTEGRCRSPVKAADKRKKVCIIGAGPGGLSAAYYLAQEGYRVSVFEAMPEPGGMMLIGIPRFRLPKEVIEREIAEIEGLGVEFRYNTRFGQDVTYHQLKNEGFEAFFLAVGAHQAYKLRIPEEDDYPQVIDAIDFLKDVALDNRTLASKKVIIIGGGNVAIDTARTCVRQGVEEVIIAYRRSGEEMPADEEEVQQAEEEGVKIHFLISPVKIEGHNGRLTGLQCQKNELVAIEGAKRKSPVPIQDSEFFIKADTVIRAIGQSVDHRLKSAMPALNMTRWKTIEVNDVTMETSIPGVFAAGDAVTGPATVIQAIAGGKKVADAIDRQLSGLSQPVMPPVPVRRARIEWQEVSDIRKMELERPQMPLLNMDKRCTTYQPVELGYPEKLARAEASRCLRCDVCIRCGKCVEICRDMMGINALEMGYVVSDDTDVTDFRITKERCILCGACAINCPSEAIKVIERNDERILSLCGTILNRQKLIYCDVCGEAIGTDKYLDHLKNRLSTMSQVKYESNMCGICARKELATCINPG